MGDSNYWAVKWTGMVEWIGMVEWTREWTMEYSRGTISPSVLHFPTLSDLRGVSFIAVRLLPMTKCIS